MEKEKALQILEVFYGRPNSFCSLHLEGKAVKALGGIRKALPYIREIVKKAGYRVF